MKIQRKLERKPLMEVRGIGKMTAVLEQNYNPKYRRRAKDLSEKQRQQLCNDLFK